MEEKILFMVVFAIICVLIIAAIIFLWSPKLSFDPFCEMTLLC